LSMKLHLLPALFMLLFPFTSRAADSVHEFTVPSITGEDMDLSQYKGKVLLIVNTASKCGFTKQYAGLVEVQNAYADRGFVVLGFPANNFGGQEPGSNPQIREFCSATYGVDFPMFAKLSVKGADQSPLFRYLTTAENPDFTGNIRWNFEKILVGPDGKVVRRFRSRTKPDGDAVTSAIEALLSTES